MCALYVNKILAAKLNSSEVSWLNIFPGKSAIFNCSFWAKTLVKGRGLVWQDSFLNEHFMIRNNRARGATLKVGGGGGGG